MNWGIRIAAILVIAGGLIWLNWDRFTEQSTEPAVLEEAIVQSDVFPARQTEEADQNTNDIADDTMAENKEPESVPPEIPEFVLQPVPEALDESDVQVRSVAQELSPEAAAWLEPDEQLRKWTLLVKQAAEGKTVYDDRPFNINLPAFVVEERNGRFFISPRNFERYTPVVNVLAKLPADKLAAYYRAWYPLLEQAFGELGLPGSFDEQLDSVIDRILAVALLEEPVELKKPTSVTYKFMDPKLEGASQIDKWLWRMGPENARQIQDLASRLKLALNKRAN